MDFSIRPEALIKQYHSNSCLCITETPHFYTIDLSTWQSMKKSIFKTDRPAALVTGSFRNSSDVWTILGPWTSHLTQTRLVWPDHEHFLDLLRNAKARKWTNSAFMKNADNETFFQESCWKIIWFIIVIPGHIGLMNRLTVAGLLWEDNLG